MINRQLSGREIERAAINVSWLVKNVIAFHARRQRKNTTAQMQKATRRNVGGDRKLASGMISRGSRILLSCKLLGLVFKFVDNYPQRNENAKKKENEFMRSEMEYRCEKFLKIHRRDTCKIV